MTLSTAAPAQVPTLIVELEGGPAWQSYNDVEIPNDGSATRFSLSELAGTGPWPAGRLYMTWNIAERHGRPAPGWRVGFDADALAGGPGRAVDAALMVG